MTPTNRPLPQREPARAGTRAARRAPRRGHSSDFSDAVVAVYIHEISSRRSRPPSAALRRASARGAAR
ncbi:MAG: hypothetical protein QOJ07_613 [Thermoleophilaceae bacterium]|jgi:hypothetical protein|nr:hypothetical protein [Thermoleophilaceae bacterium]